MRVPLFIYFDVQLKFWHANNGRTTDPDPDTYADGDTDKDHEDQGLGPGPRYGPEIAVKLTDFRATFTCIFARRWWWCFSGSMPFRI